MFNQNQPKPDMFNHGQSYLASMINLFRAFFNDIFLLRGRPFQWAQDGVGVRHTLSQNLLQRYRRPVPSFLKHKTQGTHFVWYRQSVFPFSDTDYCLFCEFFFGGLWGPMKRGCLNEAERVKRVQKIPKWSGVGLKIQKWSVISTLLYPISLSSGFWDRWSSQKSKHQYRDHLVGY